MNEIPLFKNYISQTEVDQVNKVIERKMNWAIGPEIREFESKVGSITGNSTALSYNSGTSAGYTLMRYYGVSGFEVIVPSFSFIATSNVVLMAGGKPIFADIEYENFGLDVDDVNERISPKTKIIMPIHYGGNVCNIKPLKELADDNGLILVEDACESLGAARGSKPVGSFGHSAWFSFAPTKIVSTGEGGAIVSKDKDLIRKCELLRSHGRSDDQIYFSSTEGGSYVDLGYNFRMPSMNAALGIAQLNKIEEIITLRNDIAHRYNKALSKIAGIDTLPIPKSVRCVYQMYPVLVKDGKVTRDELQTFLQDMGISSRVYFNPIHLTEYYTKKLQYTLKLPVTEEISEKVLCLPIYPGLEDGEITRIIESISNFYK